MAGVYGRRAHLACLSLAPPLRVACLTPLAIIELHKNGKGRGIVPAQGWQELPLEGEAEADL